MRKPIVFISVTLFITLVIGILTYKEEVQFDKFTIVKIENNPFDFGIMSKNDTLKHTFTITNTSKTLFVIQKVLPSCPCTTAKSNKKTCRLNETVKVDVVFIPNLKRKGKTRTTVFLQCNAEKGVLKLELTGNIK